MVQIIPRRCKFHAKRYPNGMGSKNEMSRYSKVALTAMGAGIPSAVDMKASVVSITPICPGTAAMVETDEDRIKIRSTVPNSASYPIARKAKYKAIQSQPNRPNEQQNEINTRPGARRASA